MKRVNRRSKPKKHYFDCKVSGCVIRKWRSREVIALRTICGRDPKKVKYTTFKDDVTCVVCLGMLNSQQEFQLNNPPSQRD